MDGDGGAGVSYLHELREREHARKQSRTWAAAASGQSGLPQQMFPTRQSGSGQPRLGSPLPPEPLKGETVSVSAGDVEVGVGETVQVE